ncbi:MAG: phage baseplate assembly protein V, partial [Pseudobdellovibrionaceae bacterium]|nr:phage baseplate assembly protein V [Pseudobdellovibrionaceae bacterium]
MERKSLDESAREMMMAIQDLQRRMNNILRPGHVIATDPANARVKVRLAEGDEGGGIKPFDTGWLRVLVERAGDTVDWDFPEISEQVMVLSPGGELAGGYVGHAIYSGKNPAPAKNAKLRLRKYSDGLECSYDQESHSLTISRPDGLKLIFQATALEFNTEKASIKNKAGDEV